MSLPSKGLSSIPEELAELIDPASIHLNTQVASIKPKAIVLNSGIEIQADAIIATDPWSKARLLGETLPPQGRSVACIYFMATKSPVDAPILVLNADGEGPINHLAVLSDVAPRYAPKEESLISVTVLEKNMLKYQDKLEDAVREQLESWYGQDVLTWRHVHTYKIRNAHPLNYGKTRSSYKVREGVYVCGDYLEAPCMHSAMREGRLAAEEILKHFSVG